MTLPPNVRPGDYVFVCNHCGAAFATFDLLDAHRRLVLDANAYNDDWICPKCGAHFTSPGQLAEHEARAH
jgi:hypothetical protein